jgi:diacylglycerol kinase family enzyme
VPKRRYLANLPKVFKGTHLEEPGLHLLRGRSVSFHADRPFTAYADGDPIAELPATVDVVPGTLRVLAP